MTPTSVTLISDERTILEASITASSLRATGYSGSIHLRVDNKETLLTFLKAAEGVADKITIGGFPASNNVISHGTYHSRRVLAAKLDAILSSVETYGDTLFVDSDFYFLRPIIVPEKCEVALSWNNGHETSTNPYGRFNAGLCWTSSLDLVKWWQDAYSSNRGGFYEQACMDSMPQRWKAGYFSEYDNWGWWRKGEPQFDKVRSVHLHLTREFEPAMTPMCRQWTQALRKKLFRAFPEIRKKAGYPCKITCLLDDASKHQDFMGRIRREAGRVGTEVEETNCNPLFCLLHYSVDPAFKTTSPCYIASQEVEAEIAASLFGYSDF